LGGISHTDSRVYCISAFFRFSAARFRGDGAFEEIFGNILPSLSRWRGRAVPARPGRSLHEQAHQLAHAQRHDPEHQMAHDLVVAAHPNRLRPEIVLEPSVDALDGAAFVVTDVLGQAVTEKSLPLSLVRQFLLQPRCAPGIDVDDGNMAEAAAVGLDFRRVRQAASMRS